MLQRVGLIAILGAVPVLVGCFRAMAYPEFPSCPGTTLPTTTDEVFAVRIDVSRERNAPTGPTTLQTERHTATQIDVSSGKVPEQRTLNLSYWWIDDTGEKSTGGSRNHAVMTKVYRRGYQTLVIHPGDGGIPYDWTPATKPDEQAAAIRALAYAPQQLPAAQPAPKLVPGQLPPPPPKYVFLSPGSVGAHHKRVLVYIAAEFERVAALYPPGTFGNVACRKDADEIRALADR